MERTRDFSLINNINELHDEALIQHFTNGIGHRLLALSPSYPFLFIGTIVDVMGDIVEVDVETTHFAQLENRTWYIHIHNIEVFFIERDGGPEIPQLNEYC